MRSEPIKFKGSQGTELEGRLDIPDSGKPAAWAIFAHCFGCTKNLKSIGHLNRVLTESGIGVLRFDFTGLGESGGSFADTNFTSNVNDVLSAAASLEARGAAPRLLIGHSLGGAAAIMAGQKLRSIRAVATIAAPGSLSHLEKIILSKAPQIEQTGEAEVELMGRRFHLKEQFLDDLRDHSMSRIVPALSLPLLILHAPADEVVSIAAAERLFSLAHHPKSLVSLDHADHLLLDPEDAAYAGRIIAAWFSRYLD